MNRKWLGALALLALLNESATYTQGPALDRLMRKKLECAQKILEAVVTSRWWVSDRPQYEDKATPAIHTVVILNAGAIFLQIALGAAFRHKYSPATPHVVWAMGVLLVASWTAIQLRKRFSNSSEISRVRALLHGIVGVQLLLGIAALWTRMQAVNDPQPMPAVVVTTVVHTVFGAVLFAVSILVVLFCYRLVPRRREVVFATTSDEVPA